MDGYRFLVAEDLGREAGDITIDASLMGIKVYSKLNPKDAPDLCSH